MESEALKMELPQLQPWNLARVKELHAEPCEHCPSAHHPPDPESEQFLRASRTTQLTSVFRCAWRNEKACKGWCDYLGISEEELKGFKNAEDE